MADERISGLLAAETAILANYETTRVQFTGFNFAASSAVLGFFSTRQGDLLSALVVFGGIGIIAAVIVYRISVGYAFHYGWYERLRRAAIAELSALAPHEAKIDASYEKLRGSVFAAGTARLPLYVFWPMANLAIPLLAFLGLIAVGFSPVELIAGETS